MRSHRRPGHSGPHSIHDARQYAFALLLFGPGAPAPRQRPHRGQLSDLPEPAFSRRPSAFVRFARLVRRAVFGSPPGAVPERREEPGLSGGNRQDEPGGRTTDDNRGRLAA